MKLLQKLHVHQTFKPYTNDILTHCLWTWLLQKIGLKQDKPIGTWLSTPSFSNSSLLSIYNLPSQMYVLAKFQPDAQITLGAIALQSKKIKLYSKHWEDKVQALIKMAVTYEWNVT